MRLLVENRLNTSASSVICEGVITNGDSVVPDSVCVFVSERKELIEGVEKRYMLTRR